VGKLWQFPLALLVNILRRKDKALGSERGKVLESGLPCGSAAGKVLAKAKERLRVDSSNKIRRRVVWLQKAATFSSGAKPSGRHDDQYGRCPRTYTP